MSKYFAEEGKIQLSVYLERKLSDTMRSTVEYLISCLGDVSLPIGIIEAYEDYFHSIGGRYDVRTDVETVKGLYEFYQKFPGLSKKAFSEISFRYIKDLFEEYSLDSVFEKLIQVYGETDDALDMFIIYIERKADELQAKYKKSAAKLDEYTELYHVDGLVDDYITYLKFLVIGKHMSVDKVIDSMPSPELVKKDREQLYQIAKTSRCFMGCGYPVSYLMTTSFAKGEDLSKYGERPSYYVSTRGTSEEATFTTQEFIDSIKQGRSQRSRK